MSNLASQDCPKDENYATCDSNNELGLELLLNTVLGADHVV